jgi:XTP/dITP diphosphohydrolase
MMTSQALEEISSHRRITLATQNEGKRRELARMAAHFLPAVELDINPDAPDIEETGRTFQENAILKARQSPPLHAGSWVLAEDSGLIVEALDGQFNLSPFPGIYANRWLTRERYDSLMADWPQRSREFPVALSTDRLTENGMTNTELCLGILALMAGKSNRRARYCCAMALWNPEKEDSDDGLIAVVEKSLELWITDTNTLKGQNGFGYDSIMHTYNPQTQTISPLTMAEMSMDEKNKLSHRSLAFTALVSQLKERLQDI